MIPPPPSCRILPPFPLFFSVLESLEEPDPLAAPLLESATPQSTWQQIRWFPPVLPSSFPYFLRGADFLGFQKRRLQEISDSPFSSYYNSRSLCFFLTGPFPSSIKVLSHLCGSKPPPSSNSHCSPVLRRLRLLRFLCSLCGLRCAFLFFFFFPFSQVLADVQASATGYPFTIPQTLPARQRKS